LVFVAVILVVLITILLVSGGTPRRVLNVANWDFYIGNDTIASFEREYDVRVNYDIYASNEDALALLRSSPGVYDVVIPSDYMIEIMRSEDLLTPLDHLRIPNLINVDPKFRGEQNYWDPEEEVSAPYLFGSTGFAINRSFVDEDSMSWSLLLADARGAQKYKNKVAILDDMRFVLGSVLLELGYDPNSIEPKQIDEAVQLLRAIRPLVRAFTADTGKDLLLNGDVWIAYAWNGDALQVQKVNSNVEYVIPESGSLRFQDGICIPSGSGRIDLAHKFINHVLKAEVNAEIVQHTRYGTTNVAAMPYIDDAIRTNSASFPLAEQLDRLRFIRDLGDSLSLYERAWEQVKQ